MSHSASLSRHTRRMGRRRARGPGLGTLRALAVCAGVCTALLSTAVQARRAPEPGGAVAVYADAATWARVVHEATSVPLLERVRGTPERALYHDALVPRLAGGRYRSVVLSDVRHKSGARRWVLRAHQGYGPDVLSALRQCFALAPASSEAAAWPAAVWRAARIDVQLAIKGDEVRVTTSQPVGAMPALLAGCRVRGRRVAGAFQLAPDGTLRARPDAPFPQPLVDVLARTARPDDAQLVLSADGAAHAVTDALPDLLVLVQPATIRRTDPLGIATRPGDSGQGLERLYAQLDVDALLALSGDAAGAPTRTLLPAGLAPPGHERPRALAEPAELRLPRLTQDASKVAVLTVPEDPLLDQVRGRLAVIVRDRARRIEPLPVGTRWHDNALILWRFRPASEEPALAILAMIGGLGERPALDDALIKRALSHDAGKRLEAALELERALIDQRVVVPLLTIERELGVAPGLHGARFSESGLPTFADLDWEVAP